jgi:hypothetical protein
MMAALRQHANAAAQEALRALVDHRIRHGEWQPMLAARYRAAERLVDMIDERIEAQQVEDPEAPDYFAAWTCEAVARAAFGDR